MCRFGILFLLLTIVMPVAAQGSAEVVLIIGHLNGAAKVLPMPQRANAGHFRIDGEIKVRVRTNMQKGEVMDAKLEGGGHPLLEAAVVRAAKAAKFEPVLVQFPIVYGSGFLTYKIGDFNKAAKVNTKPRSFYIISKGALNPKALIPFPKPRGVRSSGKNFVAGTVEVAVLIDSMDGKVLTVKAVSGPQELRADSETAAMKVKFPRSMISSATPLYVRGVIVYRFNKNGKVE